MSGTPTDGAAVKGPVPWGSGGGHIGLPAGRPYVWRRGRRRQAVPPQARRPVAAGDGQESGKSCKRCGYLVRPVATRSLVDHAMAGRTGVVIGRDVAR